jgi:hypothetical protein
MSQRPLLRLPATSTTADPFGPLLEHLASRVADAVAERIAEQLTQTTPAKSPTLLDRRQLAQALGVCADSVDRLRRESGFPELRVGDAPRFELDRVLEYLRGKSSKSLAANSNAENNVQELAEEPRKGTQKP